jgi:hypothetical protein
MVGSEGKSPVTLEGLYHWQAMAGAIILLGLSLAFTLMDRFFVSVERVYYNKLSTEIDQSRQWRTTYDSIRDH